MKPSIFKEIGKFLQLHCLYLKISLKYLSIYKTSSILMVFFSIAFLLAEIIVVDVYYKFTDLIGDWDQNSFYILIGSFNIMSALYTYWFEISHEEFVYKIRFGELDADLIRPMDAQAFTMLQRVDYASLLNLPIPIWLIYYGAQHSNFEISLFSCIFYLIILLAGVGIIYAINQFCSNFSFWFTDTSSLTMASDQVVQLGARPIQVYPKLIQFGVSYLIPIALCTTISVEVLQSQIIWSHLLLLAGSIAFLLLIIRFQWQLGLRYYESASS